MECGDYIIDTFQSDGRWLAKIRRKDGTAIEILTDTTGRSSPPDGTLTTSPPQLTEEDAIKLAKQAINGGGMR